MPFEFTTFISNRSSITWRYCVNDLIDPEWAVLVHSLVILGVNEDGVYATPGKWRLDISQYNQSVLENNAAQIRMLPLVDLDLEDIFPNLRSVFIYQLNINILTLPKTVTGCLLADTYISMADLSVLPSLHWVTMWWCYGCWSTINIPNTVRLLTIYGDYHDNYTVPYSPLKFKLTACKFNRFTYINRLYNANEFSLNECVSPYVNDIFDRFPINPTDIWGKIRYIDKMNHRLDMEDTTRMLVMLRNRSFDAVANESLDVLPIRAAMALGSNYPRRAMEFIADI
jgi:hypothetical protein